MRRSTGTSAHKTGSNPTPARPSSFLRIHPSLLIEPQRPKEWLLTAIRLHPGKEEIQDNLLVRWFDDPGLDLDRLRTVDLRSLYQTCSTVLRSPWGCTALESNQQPSVGSRRSGITGRSSRRQMLKLISTLPSETSSDPSPAIPP
jgi:hypothetical protein